jgi:predicted O-methyltransferase YrrM
MYSSFQLVFKYINYYLAASNGKGHGIHSPFVFDFVTKVLNDGKQYDGYEKVEDIRSRSIRDKTVLKIEDHGAGSSSSQLDQRSVSSIARHAVKSKKYGQLLYRIVKYYRPKSVVELGTSLGITTCYLSLANPDSDVLTFEGATEIGNIAKQNFGRLQLENIRPIDGNFDYTLYPAIYNLPSVDLAFVDGNHRSKPTLNYFDCLLPKMNDHSIFIFDDIHWSLEMEQAWEQIKMNPAVRCTIDLFFIGIVFFRQEFKETQHFKIRF